MTAETKTSNGCSEAQGVVEMLPPGANEWLASGERGVSSEAIFSKLTGLNLMGHWGGMWTPSDPADLRRCELLLRAVSEFRTRFSEMTEVSDTWRRLVAKWDELIATMDAESPGWVADGGRAPLTYALMRGLAL